jgi:hypothetical protein
MAIMMALTRPASEVLDLAEESFTTPAATDMSAMEALGIAAVGSALRGSTNAAAFITARLEGRPGIRSGETDPASDTAREGVQQAIEDIVRGFVEAKLAQADDDPPGDAAMDITALDPSSTVTPGRPTHDAIDAAGERPRRLDGPAE